MRIANGEVCYTGTTPGGGLFAQTFCDEEYQLEPESSRIRICLSDGTWSGSTVQCVQKSNQWLPTCIL